MPYWICPWLRDLVADSRRSNKETYLFHRLIFHRTSISIKFGRGLRDFKNRNPELLTSLFTVQRIFELNWLGLRWYFSNLLGCILITQVLRWSPVSTRGEFTKDMWVAHLENQAGRRRWQHTPPSGMRQQAPITESLPRSVPANPRTSATLPFCRWWNRGSEREGDLASCHPKV